MAERFEVNEFLMNRIYEEMKQVRTNVHYAEILLDRQIIKSKYFNVGVTLLSAGGAGLYFIEEYFAFGSAALVALVSIVNQFFPVFFMRTEELTKLAELRTEYSVYLNKLQNLFIVSYYGKIDEDTCLTRYSELYEANAAKETEMSRLFGKIRKKYERIATSKSDEYLNSIYNSERDGKDDN